MKISSHAKINLYLRVKEKRADGFHELDTIFQEIDICDELSWLPGNDPLSLDVKGIAIDNNSENLVLAAAQAFSLATGHKIGGSILLIKKIPVGGGLGGGSSNAAATLNLLNRHFDLPLTQQGLLELALTIGSDVPFFVEGGCQRGRGRGELLEKACVPVDTATQGLLIMPPFGVSTALCFSKWAQTAREPSHHEPQIGENDLFLAACMVEPRLRLIFDELVQQTPTPVFMSGSGSTLVCLTSDNLAPLRKLATQLGCRTTAFRFR